jgi:hypothetical protein
MKRLRALFAVLLTVIAVCGSVAAWAEPISDRCSVAAIDANQLADVEHDGLSLDDEALHAKHTSLPPPVLIASRDPVSPDGLAPPRPHSPPD